MEVLILMNDMNKIKASYIKGYFINHHIAHELVYKDFDLLEEEDYKKLEEIGKFYHLKLHYFKEKEDLARVKIVLGFLKNIYPNTLLDVGSGRGVFLFPLLRDFPDTNVTCLDILEKRIELLNYIHLGGIQRLNPIHANICDVSFPDDSFDVVTLLEVLEHIPDVKRAIQNAVRITKKYVVVTVPSKEDDNPEHIHLLTKDILTSMFHDCGVTNLKFGGVNGHLFLVATKGESYESYHKIS